MLVVGKMTPGADFLRVMWFSRISIIQPLLQTNLFMYYRRYLILPNDTDFKLLAPEFSFKF
jgi:hypothetical protein